MSDRIGQKIGHYRLLKLLGTGASAEVYLGEHIDLGKQAALKLLTAHAASEDIANFKEEAQRISKLEHPSIVRVLDFGVQENTPYLVMEYAPRGTLRQPRGTRLPLPTVVTFVKQVAQALQHAHDQHVIHRDVKPQNMLLGRNGEVLLSDFGIAVVTDSLSHPRLQNLAGTIPYMAPEQIKRFPCRASDQYALGIVVYEWLSGNRPFHGTLAEMMAHHCEKSPPALRNFLPDIPLAVEMVVMKALAKKPEERFGSIQDFATALEEASLTSAGLDKTPTAPLPPVLPPPEPMLNWGNHIASLTQEARHLVARNPRLGHIVDVYGPNMLLCTVRGLFMAAVGAICMIEIVPKMSPFSQPVSSEPLVSQVLGIVFLFIIMLLFLWIILLGLWRVYLAVSSKGTRAVVCANGVAFVQLSGSDRFYWQDIAWTSKKQVTLIPIPITDRDLFAYLIVRASTYSTYNVYCHDGRKFVFKDTLLHFSKLSALIETEFVRVRDYPIIQAGQSSGKSVSV